MRDDKTPALNSKSNEKPIEEILDRLERQANEAVATPDTRKERRWSYRRANLATTIEHPGGGISRMPAQGFSLWSDGIAFLFSGFAYSGSACSVVLVAKDGESMLTKGTITLCKHVEGVLHLAEVKFQQRIDPHLFVEPPKGGLSELGSQIDLANLHAKILHLDDSDFDAKLLAHHLRGSGIELKAVKQAAEALEALKTGVYDIFLCDFNLGSGTDATTVIAQSRADGYCGPIVILSAEHNPAKLQAARSAGAHHHLAKPYQRDALIQAMIKLHQEVGAITSGETIYSTFGDQPGAEELLVGYIKEAAAIAKQLDAGIAGRKLDTVRELCLNIKGSATGYGFATLGSAAEEAIKVLDDAKSVDTAKPQLRMLSLMCGRLGLRSAGVDPEKLAG